MTHKPYTASAETLTSSAYSKHAGSKADQQERKKKQQQVRATDNKQKKTTLRANYSKGKTKIGTSTNIPTLEVIINIFHNKRMKRSFTKVNIEGLPQNVNHW